MNTKRMEPYLLCVIVAVLLGGGSHSALAQSLPTLRRSAPSQVRVQWDNATSFSDGTPITSNDWPMLSTRLYRAAPGASTFVLSSTMPFTTQSSVVTVTTGVWQFAVHHVYVTNYPTSGPVTNDGPLSQMLVWTNQPIIPGAPTIL